MNFEYGQKSLNALRAITRLFDADVEWYAKGTAVILDEVTYADLVRRLARSEDED